MRTNNLIRWGGLAALLAGILSIVLEIVFVATLRQQAFSVAAMTSTWSVLYAFRLIMLVLLMLGLIALFARQSQKMHTFGVAAFVIATIGMMMIFGFAWVLLFTFPVMAEEVPTFLDAMAAQPGIGLVLTLFVTTIGWFLFGLASIRAKVLPTASAWLMMAGAIMALVLNIMQLPFSWLIFDIGVIWMGWWLWTEQMREP